MKSYSVSTNLLDDVECAAAELAAKIKEGIQLSQNTVGLLYCYSDCDVADLVAAVQARFPFDIIGCTCIASMDSGGFHDLAATLLVLTGDDCTFATAVSQPIRAGGEVAGQVESACAAVQSALGAQPGLLYAIPPYILEIMLDHYAESLNAAAPGVPVIGGLPSYMASGESNCTFFRGEAYPDRLVLLGIAGNVQPVFVVKNVSGDDVSRKRRVTRSIDNTVYEVNGQRFSDYLVEVGLPVEKLVGGNTTITFVSNPVLVENAAGDDSSFSFARTLHEVSLEEGSGTAIGKIPEGATLSVCSLQSDQIEKAAVEGARELKDLMAEKAAAGYTYSTVMAVSCIGRHLLLLPNNFLETQNLVAELPKELTLGGFYSYGEIGPQGTAHRQNFAHNESLVLVAF